MSSTDYKKTGFGKYEDRKQLFFDVLELDYLKGPTMTFKIKDRLSAINDTLVEKVLKAAEAKLPSKDDDSIKNYGLSSIVDLHLIAEFYHELQNQAPQGKKSKDKIVLNSLDDLSLFFKNTEEALAVYDKGEFVRFDDKGNKYIELTAQGESAFCHMWDCNDEYMTKRAVIIADKMITFSDLQKKKKDLVLDGDQNIASLVNNNENRPSFILSNSYGSTGLSSIEYGGPVEKVVGSRNSVKGDYLIK